MGGMPFGFGVGGSGGGFDVNSLGAALQQLGRMLQSGGEDGPVQWSVVTDVARGVITNAGDPSVSDAQRRSVTEACTLADVWLDPVTVFPATAAAPQTWCKSDWLVNTMPVWKRIVEPIGAQMSAAMNNNLPALGSDPQAVLNSLPENVREMLPEGFTPDMAAMLVPMLGMVQKLGAAAFSMQLGQALGSLSGDVLSASDIGIPLTEEPSRAIVAGAVAEFGSGLNIDEKDVMLYVALRESAHDRLFAHVPWLRARAIGAVEAYAQHMHVSSQRLSEAMQGIDISNPEALQELMAGGLVEPEPTDEQRAALARLETLLALIEGWVDEVVTRAIGDRMPSAPALQEAFRRRRAAGGPAEKSFGTLIGMELRPRLAREAGTVFAAVRSSQGESKRDALWGHPDFLPDAEQLEDPLGFVETVGENSDEPPTLG
ncbi:MAG: hypothetical protein RJB01_806 [Actinomycetota bacterium]|jgi:putative hydrolase